MGKRILVHSLHGVDEVVLVDTLPAGTWVDAGTVAARAGAALMVACRDRSSLPRMAKLSGDLRD